MSDGANSSPEIRLGRSNQKMPKTITFLGCGRMASALITCIAESKKYAITVSTRTKEKAEGLKKKYAVQTAPTNTAAIKNADVIFIGVKPQDIDCVLGDIRNAVSERQLVVSIAAGITLDYLLKKLQGKKIIRLMPNINCMVGEMAAGYAVNRKVTKADIKIFKNILMPCGVLYEVDESLLDAVTALCGSGPAFIAAILDGIIAAGIKNGLAKETTHDLALQTLKGTALLMQEKNISPEEVIAMVASPNGTTRAGLDIFEKHELKKIIANAIDAAVNRSRELKQ